MSSAVTNPGAVPPSEPHGHAQPAALHYIPYYLIFMVLVALTAITVMVASHRYPSELVNVLLALLIASIKAICVARYFMHLKFEGKLIHAILIVPLFLAVVLAVALIPDIGMGRTTDFNDSVGWFERMIHSWVGVIV
jgi:cytochrome c oxidase subunit 4